MFAGMKKIALLAFITGSASVSKAQATSGTGITTRYWDCCKGSCSWSGKAAVSAPVTTCDISDNPLADMNAASGCQGGPAYMCTNQSPWQVSDTLSYGFAAAKISGATEADWCCACYQLDFTSAPLIGKTLIVQATNTGADLGEDQFDLAIPGGGVGIYNGCTAEFGAPSSGWGQQYGGISSRSDCDSFPEKLKAGCYWRFDWFAGADNPNVNWKKVTCPKALTDITGCIRNGETPTVGQVATSAATSAAVTTGSPTTSSKSSTSTSASPAASSSASSGTVAHWGQCGGINYSGPTQCVSGTSCKWLNDWYWQCL
ncbi:carbohydrate-binding module family 1 protein [Lepidopterella palustris CBS 459.81]|uniref:Cellulase n=1 Tax=Lepidopterella palustris CBS 459.81 TaxID=1314670 RepID=A0A8E2E6L0_9PEZI|nr:carbohydrate-binding module family 1 protein [Lepidopterella palustris CBS 459.81]